MDSLAVRSYELWLMQYRRTWRGTIAATIVNPVLYLAALGVGLGAIVDRSEGWLGASSYLEFVAPGLLAAAAMQLAANESTWAVLGAIKWTHEYHSMLATPIRVADVLAGHQLWIATRILVSSAVYLAVIGAFGGVASPLAVLALPAALLVGIAFAAPVAGVVAWLDSDEVFSPLSRFVITPMFLFAGTFFPVSELPVAFRSVAYATPLWHGTELCRGLTLGTIGLPAGLGHVAYLLAFTAGGLLLAHAAYRRRLLT